MASNVDYRAIARDGLWKSNPGLVQILGLCPLLATSNSAVNGLGLGIATLLTLVISNGSISLIRNWVRQDIRIPVFVLVIASVVTAIELSMNAYFHDLYLILGIFIPLIVTNCIITARAESFASKNPLLPSLVDGFMMGLGLLLVMVALGMIRELLGHGTVFANAHLMLGDLGHQLNITVFDHYHDFLLAILPPGAFIGLGLLIALKNTIDSKMAGRKTVAVAREATPTPGTSAA
ncbi:MAG: electron transport complex subunit E [Gammaproteobacteria bacterium]|nr:electron transport complex subunit E [Gammaproteobacteria bacterium]